ncbi:MAG: DUF1302 family protein [candidate division KSB1 bacterium]|nr:DUF1302 family protein [candidate division KSB1 bacterium]
MNCKIKPKALRFILAGLVLLFAVHPLLAQGLSINGYVRQYTGVLTSEDTEYLIVQNTLDLELRHSKGDVAFKANPYVYHYRDRDQKIGLREAYIDIYFRSMDVRVGKQQIIWGKAQGVFITDIVSPKDLREFLLPDFEEIRMGVTAVKADYYIGNHALELVWLPVFTPTRMPEEGSIWRPRMDFPITPQFDTSQQEVEGSLKNSEWFIKYSALTSALDVEIMAGTAWDDDPTLHISKRFDPQNRQLDALTVTPKHHRLTLGGGSFSTTLGPVVMRGEGAFYRGKYFNTADPTVADAVVEKDYMHYLLGLDYSIWDIQCSGQFIQEAILDYEPGIEQDEFENTMTVRARRDFLRETLTLELFSYIGLNHNDALIRPRLYYDLSDGFEILLGANLFTGDQGRFGQYEDNDMGYFKIKYSF